MPPREREIRRDTKTAVAVAALTENASPSPPPAPQPIWPNDRVERLAKLIAKVREIESERLANHTEADRLNARNVELTKELGRLKADVDLELWGGKPPV